MLLHMQQLIETSLHSERQFIWRSTKSNNHNSIALHLWLKAFSVSTLVGVWHTWLYLTNLFSQIITTCLCRIRSPCWFNYVFNLQSINTTNWHLEKWDRICSRPKPSIIWSSAVMQQKLTRMMKSKCKRDTAKNKRCFRNCSG